MTYFYTDTLREHDPFALSDAEVFYIGETDGITLHEDSPLFNDFDLAPGHYWWPCFPGCLPDGDPIGPFLSEVAAIQDARRK